MIEIIKRMDGYKAEKTHIEGDGPKNVQVSYNDWGHLCVRIIKCFPVPIPEDKQAELFKAGMVSIPEYVDGDTLIVFNKEVSNRIIRFIKNNRDMLPF
jgi:hypothetical protein